LRRSIYIIVSKRLRESKRERERERDTVDTLFLLAFSWLFRFFFCFFLISSNTTTSKLTLNYLDRAGLGRRLGSRKDGVEPLPRNLARSLRGPHGGGALGVDHVVVAGDAALVEVLVAVGLRVVKVAPLAAAAARGGQHGQLGGEAELQPPHSLLDQTAVRDELLEHGERVVQISRFVGAGPAAGDARAGVPPALVVPLPQLALAFGVGAITGHPRRRRDVVGVQPGSSGGRDAAVHGVAAAALHLAARVAHGHRVGQLEVLLDVVDEAVDDVAVPEEGLEVLTRIAAATVVWLFISLRRHDRARGHGHY